MPWYEDWQCIGVLVSPYPGQEGNKLMFLSEWREFPSALCLAGVRGGGGGFFYTSFLGFFKSGPTPHISGNFFLPGGGKRPPPPLRTASTVRVSLF